MERLHRVHPLIVLALGIFQTARTQFAPNKKGSLCRLPFLLHFAEDYSFSLIHLMLYPSALVEGVSFTMRQFIVSSTSAGVMLPVALEVDQ